MKSHRKIRMVANAKPSFRARTRIGKTVETHLNMRWRRRLEIEQQNHGDQENKDASDQQKLPSHCEPTPERETEFTGFQELRSRSTAMRASDRNHVANRSELSVFQNLHRHFEWILQHRDDLAGFLNVETAANGCVTAR